MTSPNEQERQHDVSRLTTLGERLAEVVARLRSRHLVVFAWASGFRPVLLRADALSQPWGKRFERYHSGVGMAVADLHLAGPSAVATGMPVASPPGAKPAERSGRVPPVDIRTRLRAVAGPGADGMRVRVDTGADAVTRRLRADAVTVGTDVLLRSGRYRPDTPEGFALLAHEASHITALLSPSSASRRLTPGGVAAEEETAERVEMLARRRDGGGAAAFGRGGAAPRMPAVPMSPIPTAPSPAAPATAAAAPARAAAARPMRADADRVQPADPAPFDIDALRRGLIDDLMHRLRTDSERGG
jgi:hypothetical protein